ncbi:MAG: ABC transporter ATP-binding protein [Candidatus Paceibacterota bacterium]|jgi:putative ABC transport system ATP-binding protein
MALIETNNLVKVYVEGGVETRALDGASLTINDGEFLAITGASGSGKSTLLQMLGCLDRQTSGEYLFEGKEVSSYSDTELAHIRNEKLGFVFQAFNLLPRLSVLDNVMLPLVYAGVSKKERVQRSEAMIELVGLADRRNYQAAQLSGGQKQRVAIARALVNNPKIIFADEPTGNLDSKSGAVVLEFLQMLNDQGRTLVVVTHELYVAEAARRTVHIVDGRIDSDKAVAHRRIIAKDGFVK